MVKTLFISLFLSATSVLCAQDYANEFFRLLDEKDTLGMEKILKEWDETGTRTPEYFTCYYNYYFFISQNEMVSLTTERPDGEYFELKDSLGNTAGYMGSTLYYNTELLQKGIDKINEGIGLFPDRLDMWFGKVYTYGELENWDSFSSTIINILHRSAKNRNNWLWTLDEKVEEGQDFLLSTIQDYQLQIYNTENDSLLPYMRKISLAVLEYYPRHVESLTNIGITYILEDKFEKALQYLLKAEKIDPEDYIVLSDIAFAYKQMGENKKAINYYKKTIKYGDEPTRQYAREQIELLKK